MTRNWSNGYLEGITIEEESRRENAHIETPLTVHTCTSKYTITFEMRRER